MGTNTLTKTKPFDRYLYNKTDGKGKRKIIEFLRSKNHIVKENKENYKCDVKSVSSQGVITFSEVELKLSWQGEWPKSWTDIRIPYRKKKLLDEIESELTFYVLRNDCKEMWVIPDYIVRDKAKIVEVPNRYVPKGEQFYTIPVTLLEKVKL